MIKKDFPHQPPFIEGEKKALIYGRLMFYGTRRRLPLPYLACEIGANAKANTVPLQDFNRLYVN